jgi:hypothetical protein
VDPSESVEYSYRSTSNVLQTLDTHLRPCLPHFSRLCFLHACFPTTAQPYHFISNVLQTLDTHLRPCLSLSPPFLLSLFSPMPVSPLPHNRITLHRTFYRRCSIRRGYSGNERSGNNDYAHDLSYGKILYKRQFGVARATWSSYLGSPTVLLFGFRSTHVDQDGTLVHRRRESDIPTSSCLGDGAEPRERDNA